MQVLKEPKWSKTSTPVSIAMTVLSAPTHFEQREQVRKEFEKLKPKLESQFRSRVTLTFILGQVNCSSLAKQLEHEHKTRKDLFQVLSVLCLIDKNSSFLLSVVDARLVSKFGVQDIGQLLMVQKYTSPSGPDSEIRR